MTYIITKVTYVVTGRNEVVAKVMFVQVCVCPQGGRVSASVHAGMPYPPTRDQADLPRDQADPPQIRQTPHPPDQADTPPGTKQTPPPPGPSRPPPGPGRPPPGKQTPAYGLRAAGTHPTGMHSCCYL